MRAFIDAGFDISTRGRDGNTILHEATTGGLEMMIYILQLEGGKNLINARARDGSTPLNSEIREGGFVDVKRAKTELLFQHGADIHASDVRQDTPVHLAVRQGPLDCVRLFIISCRL